MMCMNLVLIVDMIWILAVIDAFILMMIMKTADDDDEEEDDDDG